MQKLSQKFLLGVMFLGFTSMAQATLFHPKFINLTGQEIKISYLEDPKTRDTWLLQQGREKVVWSKLFDDFKNTYVRIVYPDTTQFVVMDTRRDCKKFLKFSTRIKAQQEVGEHKDGFNWTGCIELQPFQLEYRPVFELRKDQIRFVGYH